MGVIIVMDTLLDRNLVHCVTVKYLLINNTALIYSDEVDLEGNLKVEKENEKKIIENEHLISNNEKHNEQFDSDHIKDAKTHSDYSDDSDEDDVESNLPHPRRRIDNDIPKSHSNLKTSGYQRTQVDSEDLDTFFAEMDQKLINSTTNMVDLIN